MANRNFKNHLYSFDQDPVFIFGECTIGTTGAISGIKGTGISTITNETGTGNFSITLADKYNRFLGGTVSLLANYIVDAKTSLTGRSEVQTATYVDKATCTSGDYMVLTDSAGLTWAAATDKTGSAPEPTSAEWAAIPAARKVNVNISGATTAGNVATAMKAGWEGLVSFPFTVGISTADLAFTCVLRANITNAALRDSAGTGAGTSVSGVLNSTAGILTSVNVTDNTFTLASHGFITGRKIQASISGGGTLPSGITTTTDYFVIKVDVNTFKLAASLANAQAGTDIDITDYGTADKTMTFTPFNPFGSAVAHVEFTSVVNDTLVQAGSAIPFTCYDYAGAAIDPIPQTVLKIMLIVRNSSVKGKGE